MNFVNLRSKSKTDEAEKKVRIVDDPDLTVVLCDYVNQFHNLRNSVVI